MCKTPSRLLGTEGSRVQRVACGSSHSFAWAEANSSCEIFEDSQPFSPSLDPLGTNVVHLKHPFSSPNLVNIAKMMKDQRPSLVRTVLQLHSKDLQKDALKKILQASEILFSRKMLTRFLRNVKQVTDPAARSWMDEIFCVERLINLLKLALNGHSYNDNASDIEKYLKDICHNNSKVRNTRQFIVSLPCFSLSQTWFKH